jgi:peptidoglycan/xylan/chitin deacetylase (PgdA/CDA1 family)
MGRRLGIVSCASGVLVVVAASVWWFSPWLARRADGLTERVLFHADTREPVVALTLDDGPSPSTAGILNLLERHGARATFFVLAEEVRAHPGVARRIVASGHELGNHFLRDRPSWRLPREEVERALRRSSAILAPFDTVRWVRPGGGWFDGELLDAARDRGLRVALGSVYPFDAWIERPGVLASFVVERVRPGSVIVLHEGGERGPRTVEVLRRILPALDRRGYRVVTLSDLHRAAGQEHGPGADGERGRR